MADFTIRVAGHRARILSLYESTRDYCRNYLAKEEPEDTITVSREELAQEQGFLEQEAREEGLRLRKFTEPFLERAVIQKKLAQQLLRHGILMVHGSTVAVDGEGFLFMAAKCGTGKSTHTRLWRQVFGQRAVMVNADKPFLEITGEGALAHGSPWSGKHGLDTNISVPLKGICVLRRGEENRIRRIASEEILPMLRHQGHCPEDAQLQEIYCRQTAALVQTVPVWEMECTKDPEAALMAHAAMTKP